ncbi:hypothetical protein HNY73_004290 [Argiope bruennichi]|uniref:Transposase IS30-like HTH domain-containing protein n=1 Tax=Argiope bruennichi TaxID=94029 RepID=A0A8T0FNS1_ARGBR|nr:hypothetical protein HNY73_004290 [Argiope bruennichi]
MAKGKKLTDRERGQIEALSSTGMSSRAIAIKIGRSTTVVSNFNFLKLKGNYGKKNTGGRPKALSSRDERRVCQLASTGKYSTMKLIPTTDASIYLIFATDSRASAKLFENLKYARKDTYAEEASTGGGSRRFLTDAQGLCAFYSKILFDIKRKKYSLSPD